MGFILSETAWQSLGLKDVGAIHEMKVKMWCRRVAGVAHLSEALTKANFIATSNLNRACTSMSKEGEYFFIRHLKNYVIAQQRPKVLCLVRVEHQCIL